MATVHAHHRPNLGAIRVLAAGPGVQRDMFRRGHRVRSRAVRLVGVDHGRLRASIVVEVEQRAGTFIARVGSRVDYAYVHHEGRGEVRPVRARALRFRPKGARGVVFAMRSRAVKGNPYLRDALPAARG